MGYKPVFSSDALAFFVSISRRRQRSLIDRSEELAAYPFLVPDSVSIDDDGREICHVFAGGFLFTYWVDHAVRILMIVDIESAK